MRNESNNRSTAVYRDQAASLRQARDQRRNHKVQGVTRVLSFTSGKGGVGKTQTVVNAAIALARLGKSVLILDADLGLANVNVMLGLQPKFTLYDVFTGKKSLKDIIIAGPEGISIIPAASGVESICNLDEHKKMMLMSGIEEIGAMYDYLLIDTRAGISNDVMYFNSASSEIVCVINNEPTSLTDAYAVIKVLASHYGEKRVSVIANNVNSEQDGLQAYHRLSKAVHRFLQVDLTFLGFIPHDTAVTQSVMQQRPVMDLFPSTKASLAIQSIGRKLDEEFWQYRVKGGLQFFFEQILAVNANGI